MNPLDVAQAMIAQPTPERLGVQEARDVGALETLEDGMAEAGVARHMRPRGSSQREHPSTVA